MLGLIDQNGELTIQPGQFTKLAITHKTEPADWQPPTTQQFPINTLWVTKDHVNGTRVFRGTRGPILNRHTGVFVSHGSPSECYHLFFLDRPEQANLDISSFMPIVNRLKDRQVARITCEIIDV